MTARQNPFVHAGANDLPPDILLSYYIEDGNYSRFLQSRRNVLLVGERGSGKSMALLYNSWPIQSLKARNQGEPLNYGMIGVYVPCNTTLMRKVDPELLTEVQESAVFEHFLVLSMVREIVSVLERDPSLFGEDDQSGVRDVFEYIIGQELPRSMAFPEAVKAFVDRCVRETQQALNTPDSFDAEYRDTFSFSSLVLPLLRSLRKIQALQDTHFMLLIDDAHDLNSHQMEALNSWISYRDHSLFSMKVAIANMSKYSLRTSSGGAILDGHDYMQLDMVRQLHNERTDFGQLAKRLIDRRLTRFNIDNPPEEFFPISPSLKEDLKASEEIVRQEAIAKYGENGGRKIADHVYKYARAHYFRTRPPRANRPEYSGFQTLVFLSTGVIRNLLIPCYWMYEKILSQQNANDSITSIPPQVQSETIIERSQVLWDRLREGLDNTITDCSNADAIRAYQLLDQLAILFRERLLHHSSEPRANSFTISGESECSTSIMENLKELLRLLAEAQYLYIRSGPAKDKGRREWYYVPNRLLWPERGLDPHGQHARVSLKAADLWASADRNVPLPVNVSEPDNASLFTPEPRRD